MTVPCGHAECVEAKPGCSYTLLVEDHLTQDKNGRGGGERGCSHLDLSFNKLYFFFSCKGLPGNPGAQGPAGTKGRKGEVGLPGPKGEAVSGGIDPIDPWTLGILQKPEAFLWMNAEKLLCSALRTQKMCRC